MWIGVEVITEPTASRTLEHYPRTATLTSGLDLRPGIGINSLKHLSCWFLFISLKAPRPHLRCHRATDNAGSKLDLSFPIIISQRNIVSSLLQGSSHLSPNCKKRVFIFLCLCFSFSSKCSPKDDLSGLSATSQTPLCTNKALLQSACSCVQDACEICNKLPSLFAFVSGGFSCLLFIVLQPNVLCCG